MEGSPKAFGLIKEAYANHGLGANELSEEESFALFKSAASLFKSVHVVLDGLDLASPEEISKAMLILNSMPLHILLLSRELHSVPNGLLSGFTSLPIQVPPHEMETFIFTTIKKSDKLVRLVTSKEENKIKVMTRIRDKAEGKCVTNHISLLHSH